MSEQKQLENEIMNEREMSRDWHHFIGDRRDSVALSGHDNPPLQSPKRGGEDPANALNVTMQFKQLMMCVEEEIEDDTVEARSPHMITPLVDLEPFEDY
jgi:hypothetical protein